MANNPIVCVKTFIKRMRTNENEWKVNEQKCRKGKHAQPSDRSWGDLIEI